MSYHVVQKAGRTSSVNNRLPKLCYNVACCNLYHRQCNSPFKKEENNKLHQGHIEAQHTVMLMTHLDLGTL